MTASEYWGFFCELILWWSNNTSLSYGNIRTLIIVVVLMLAFYFGFATASLFKKNKGTADWTLIIISVYLLIGFLVAASIFFVCRVFDIMTDMIY